MGEENLKLKTVSYVHQYAVGNAAVAVRPRVRKLGERVNDPADVAKGTRTTCSNSMTYQQRPLPIANESKK